MRKCAETHKKREAEEEEELEMILHFSDYVLFTSQCSPFSTVEAIKLATKRTPGTKHIQKKLNEFVSSSDHTDAAVAMAWHFHNEY